MPCFVVGQEKNKRINMCEIGGMIVPEHFTTTKHSRDTKGDFRKGEEEKAVRAEREKERGPFPAKGHTRTETKMRELKDNRRMKDGDKWQGNDITHLFMCLCVIQLGHQSIISLFLLLLLVLLRQSCNKQ